MWHLGTWFSSRLDSIGFTFGLDLLKGLFQPKQFYPSSQGKSSMYGTAVGYRVFVCFLGLALMSAGLKFWS